jgi:hypothetical protein
MKRIKITKTAILLMAATSAFFAYNNWRQKIDAPVKQGMETIKGTASEKTAATNAGAVSDDSTWNDVTGYKYIYATGIPVVYN